jgi:dTDP-4-dehydrorhamnose 3,5-epimerase
MARAMADARFAIEATPIAGLHVVQRKRVEDARGFLTRLYCAEDLRAAGFDGPIAQINHTLTRAAGAVRGMHFQYPPAAEDKYVTCIRGEVLDVAVDLRAGSPTFLHWHGVVLSPDNARSYFIPKGFAHGFQTLVADSELLYLHTMPYAPSSEGALNALDPRLAIGWPLPVTDMSQRDRDHPFIDTNFAGITL